MKKVKENLNELREVKIISTGYTRPGHITPKMRSTGFSVRDGNCWKPILPATATSLP